MSDEKTITIDLTADTTSTPEHVTDPASAAHSLSEAAKGRMPGTTFVIPSGGHALIEKFPETADGQKVYRLIGELARTGRRNGVRVLIWRRLSEPAP